MKRVKRRTFAGVVCEQEVYNVSDGTKNIKRAEPRPRFKNDEERAVHRLGMSRRYHARLVNANFTPASLYSTLTFDDEHEVFSFTDAKRIRDNYIRRLRHVCPGAVIFVYLGRGKTTHRIHLHMLSDGIPKSVIIDKWGMGDVRRIEPLRKHCRYNGVDHGPDYTGLADYLFNHWTPEQGGHRWKMTRNARLPEREDAVEVKRAYSEEKPPMPPAGYVLVESRSTSYGYLYFKYVKEQPKHTRGGRAATGNVRRE